MSERKVTIASGSGLCTSPDNSLEVNPQPYNDKRSGFPGIGLKYTVYCRRLNGVDGTCKVTNTPCAVLSTFIPQGVYEQRGVQSGEIRQPPIQISTAAGVVIYDRGKEEINIEDQTPGRLTLLQITIMDKLVGARLGQEPDSYVHVRELARSYYGDHFSSSNINTCVVGVSKLKEKLGEGRRFDPTKAQVIENRRNFGYRLTFPS